MRGLLVARPANLVEGPELRLGAARDQRPSGQVAYAFPARLEGYVEEHGHRLAADLAPVVVVQDDPSAEGDDRIGLEHCGQGFLLQGAKGLLAVGGENLGDRHAGLVLDQMVKVKKWCIRPLRRKCADYGLARTHEAEQRERFAPGYRLQAAGIGGDSRSWGRRRRTTTAPALREHENLVAE